MLQAQTTVATRPPAVASVATGFDYSRGDYGFATDTEVLSVPLNLGYESGPWLLSAGFSHLTIKGPATVVGGSGATRPTADEDRGLGTGATDYYGELTLSRTVGNATPFLTAGYRVLGDNASYHLRNGAYVSGGAHFRVSAASVITAMLNWRQPIVAGGDDSVDALLMITHNLNTRWRFMAYGLAGFTDASPDVGTGMQLNYRF